MQKFLGQGYLLISRKAASCWRLAVCENDLIESCVRIYIKTEMCNNSTASD